MHRTDPDFMLLVFSHSHENREEMTDTVRETEDVSRSCAAGTFGEAEHGADAEPLCCFQT